MTAAEELAQMEELAALEAQMKKSARPNLPQMVTDVKDYIVRRGKDLMRGAANQWADLGEGASIVAGEGMRFSKSPPVREDIAKLLPTPDPSTESNFEAYSRRTAEGFGGGAAVPVPGVGLVKNGVTGAISGIGGETGRRIGTMAGMPVAGDVAGSLFGGLAGGFALGPKQSVAQADIRRELVDTPPGDWAKAAENVKDFNNVGATTATVAEAFPGKTRIKALAQNAANSKGGEALAAQLAGRDDDLKLLGETFMDRVNPEVSPNAVANQLSDAANDAKKTLYSLGSTATGNRLAGKSLRASEVADIYRSLQTTAQNLDKTQPSLAQVYREVADMLLTTQKNGFVTDLQGLSYQLKNLKDSPVGMNASAGKKGADAMWKTAIGDAETRLGEKSSDWADAMKDWQNFRQGPVADMERGAVGKVADRNPNIETPTPASKLNAFTEGYLPKEIQGNARLLSDPGMTGGATVSPLDIARALAQTRLKAGSTNPGATMRGLEGSPKEREFAALLSGRNADEVLKPLAVSDKLQDLAGTNGIQGPPNMRTGQFFIRPFRTLDMMLTGRSEKATQAEIAKLLRDATPESLAKLKEIAMFDPTVRRQLMLVQGMLGATRAGQEGQ